VQKAAGAAVPDTETVVNGNAGNMTGRQTDGRHSRWMSR